MSAKHLLYIGWMQKKKEGNERTTAITENTSDGHCSYLTSSSSFFSSINPLAWCPYRIFFFFLFLATLQYPCVLLLLLTVRLFLFFFLYFHMYMSATDGAHMCQNWHRWEEWWRPLTVTWERKTIRIPCGKAEHVTMRLRDEARTRMKWMINNKTKSMKEKRMTNIW